MADDKEFNPHLISPEQIEELIVKLKSSQLARGDKDLQEISINPDYKRLKILKRKREIFGHGDNPIFEAIIDNAKIDGRVTGIHGNNANSTLPMSEIARLTMATAAKEDVKTTKRKLISGEIVEMNIIETSRNIDQLEKAKILRNKKSQDELLASHDRIKLLEIQLENERKRQVININPNLPMEDIPDKKGKIKKDKRVLNNIDE